MHGEANIRSSEAFGIHQSDSCLCLIRDVAMKLAQAGFGALEAILLGETDDSKLKGKTGTVINSFFY